MNGRKVEAERITPHAISFDLLYSLRVNDPLSPRTSQIEPNRRIIVLVRRRDEFSLAYVEMTSVSINEQRSIDIASEIENFLARKSRGLCVRSENPISVCDQRAITGSGPQ